MGQGHRKNRSRAHAKWKRSHAKYVKVTFKVETQSLTTMDEVTCKVGQGHIKSDAVQYGHMQNGKY